MKRNIYKILFLLLLSLYTIGIVYGEDKEMNVTIKRVKAKEMKVTIKRVKAKEMKVTIKRVKAKEMKVTIKRVKGGDKGTDEGTEMTLTIIREAAKAATGNEMTLTITREKAKAATGNEMTLTITREKAKAATGNEMTLTITREAAKAATGNEMTLTITREKAKAADNEMTLTITREKAKDPNLLEVIVTREKSKLLEVIVTRKKPEKPEKPKDKLHLSVMTLDADGRGGWIAADFLAHKVLGRPLSIGYKVDAQYVLEKMVDCEYFIKRDKAGKPVYGTSRTYQTSRVDQAKARKLSEALVPQVKGGRVDTKKHRIFAEDGTKELTVSLTATGATGTKAIEGANPCGGSKIVTGKVFATRPGVRNKTKVEYKYAVVSVEGFEVIEEAPTSKVDEFTDHAVKDGTSYDMLLGSKMILKPVVHYRVGDEKKSTSQFSGLEVKANGGAVSAAYNGNRVIVNAVRTTNARLTLTLRDEKGVVRFQKLIKVHVEKFASDYEFLGSLKKKQVYKSWDDSKKISGHYYLPAGDVVVYRVKAEGGVKMVKYGVKWSDGSVTPFKFTDSNGLVSEKRVVFTGDYGTQSPIVKMTAQLVRASGQGRLAYLNYRYQFQHTLVPTWPVVEEISFSPESQTLNFPMEQLQVATYVQPLVLTVKYKNGTEKKIIARSIGGDDYAKMLRDSPLEKYIEHNRSGSKGVGLHGKGLSPNHWHPPHDHHSRYKVGDSIPDGYYDLKEGEEGTAIFTATIETNEKAGLFVEGGKLTAKAEVTLHRGKPKAPPSIKEITADSPFIPGKNVTVSAEIDNLGTSISEAELNRRYEAIWTANPPLAGSLESEKSPIAIENGKFITRNKYNVSATAGTLIDAGVNVGINVKLIEKGK